MTAFVELFWGNGAPVRCQIAIVLLYTLYPRTRYPIPGRPPAPAPRGRPILRDTEISGFDRGLHFRPSTGPMTTSTLYRARHGTGSELDRVVDLSGSLSRRSVSCRRRLPRLSAVRDQNRLSLYLAKSYVIPKATHVHRAFPTYTTCRNRVTPSI